MWKFELAGVRVLRRRETVILQDEVRHLQGKAQAALLPAELPGPTHQFAADVSMEVLEQANKATEERYQVAGFKGKTDLLQKYARQGEPKIGAYIVQRFHDEEQQLLSQHINSFILKNKHAAVAVADRATGANHAQDAPFNIEEFEPEPEPDGS